MELWNKVKNVIAEGLVVVEIILAATPPLAS
jgi:hypothetical protein